MEYTEDMLKDWVKKHKAEVIAGICGACEPVETKTAIFMAGSPGAGKTETATRLVEAITAPFVHIDQDKIKSLLPGYTGDRAEMYHGAASIGVDIVLSHIFKQGYNFVLDSTMSQIEKAKQNIERSLKREYGVRVFFVYQNPKNAWEFVQKRKQAEGRVVPKEAFVRQFVNARVVVNTLKEVFGDRIALYVVLKIVDKDGIVHDDIRAKVENIDTCLDRVYTTKQEVLKDI